jgi:putative flavoprotein involved in K+ transport
MATTTADDPLDVAVVGAGPAGIGVGVALEKLDLDVRILDREAIGASFRAWPEETRLLTPSFPGGFGQTDLNAVTPHTSPAFALDCEHPTGEEYAGYLEGVAEFHDLPVETGVEVRDVDPVAERRKRPEAVAVDGGTAGFVLETSEGPVHSRFVVWAAGEFGSPRREPFPGAESCVHTADVNSWRGYADRGGEFLVVGGYESGIDAAVGLVDEGARATVLNGGAPWALRHPDPSEALSPYTSERLREALGTGRLTLVHGARVERVAEEGPKYRVDVAPQELEFDAEPATDAIRDPDGEYRMGTPPLLATGFEPTLGPVDDRFPREEGSIGLTDRDESPETPGLFLAGPAVAHNGVEFCFVYKYRTRFAVVAETIGERLDVDTGPLAVYREEGMFVEDLECCEPELCDC